MNRIYLGTKFILNSNDLPNYNGRVFVLSRDYRENSIEVVIQLVHRKESEAYKFADNIFVTRDYLTEEEFKLLTHGLPERFRPYIRTVKESYASR